MAVRARPTDGRTHQRELPAPLVGRAAELAALEQYLERARRGQGCLMLLAGETGVGKTRLARELLAIGQRLPLLVLEGDCYPVDRGAGYQPFVAALRCALRLGPDLPLKPVWRAALRPLLPELGPQAGVEAQPPARPPASQVQSLRSEAFFRALRSLARPAGLILLLEDLHWADRTSLDVLRYVARGLEHERILIIATYRLDETRADSPLRQALTELRRLPVAARLQVQPLDLQATSELVALRLPELDRAAAARVAELVYSKTSGNSYFVEEVVRRLAEAGNVEAVGAEPASDRVTLIVPRSVEDAVTERLRALSPTARRVITWAAVMGREFGFPVIAGLIGDESAVLEALRELIERRLVEPAPQSDRFLFHHAIVRDVVYARMLAPERQQLHRLVAETIEGVQAADLRPHLAELAFHWEQAGDPGRAFEYTVRAGEWSAEVHANGEAAAHFERALQLWPAGRSPERRLRIMEAFAEAYTRLGDVPAAEKTYRGVLEVYLTKGDRRGAARIRGKLARLCFTAGEWAAGLGHCEVGRSLVADLEAPVEEAAVLHMAACLQFAQGDHAGSVAAAREALALAERAGEDRAICEVCTHLTYLTCDDATTEAGQSLAAAESFGRRALRAAERLSDPILEGHPAKALSYLFGYIWQDLERGEAWLRRTLDSARRAGSPHDEASALSMLGSIIALPRGHWLEAEQLARSSLELATRAGASDIVAGASVLLGAVAAVRGEHAAARECFEGVLSQAGHITRWHYVHWCRTELGVLLVEQGELDEAIYVLEQGSDHPQMWAITARASRLAEAYLLAGDLAQAREWSDRGLREAQTLGFVWETLEARRVAALIAAAEGDYATAISELEATTASHARIGRPYDLARHMRDLAAVLIRQGETPAQERAADLLRDAAATFERLGARHHLVLTHAVARQHRISLPEAADAETEPADGQVLTAREREIVALIAQGLSNRQIAEQLVLSVRTVERHIENLYAKLGVSGRVARAAAAAFALRHGLA